MWTDSTTPQSRIIIIKLWKSPIRKPIRNETSNRKRRKVINSNNSNKIKVNSFITDYFIEFAPTTYSLPLYRGGIGLCGSIWNNRRYSRVIKSYWSGRKQESISCFASYPPTYLLCCVFLLNTVGLTKWVVEAYLSPI